MTDEPDLESLREAKRLLQAEFEQRAWFRGCGIAPSGDGLALRLNVDPAVEPDEGEIPSSFRGHKVDVVRIGSYRPR